MRTHPTDRPAAWSLQRRHISRHSLPVEIVTSPLAATQIFFWTSRITELNPIRSSAEEGVSLRAICGFFRASVRTRCRSDRPDGFREMIKCPKFYDLNGIGTIGKSRKDNDRSSGFVSRRKSIPDTPGIFRSSNVASASLTVRRSCFRCRGYARVKRGATRGCYLAHRIPSCPG